MLGLRCASLELTGLQQVVDAGGRPLDASLLRLSRLLGI
jgi:hypothetical protein